MGFLFGAGTNHGYHQGYHGHHHAHHAHHPHQSHAPHYHHNYHPYPSHAHKNHPLYQTNDAYMYANNPYVRGDNSNPMYQPIHEHSYPEATPYYEAIDPQAHGFPVNPYEHGQYPETQPYYFASGSPIQPYAPSHQPFIYQAEPQAQAHSSQEGLRDENKNE